MTKKDKVDETLTILDKWNKRKMGDKEALSQLFNLWKKYIIPIPFKKSPRYCKFCGKLLPEPNISYCDRECMDNDTSPHKLSKA